MGVPPVDGAALPAGGRLPDALPRRVIGRYETGRSGPTLVVVGGLHGNELAGVRAARNVVARLQGEQPGLRGRFVAIAGNRRAIAHGLRYLDEDLNRLWPFCGRPRRRAAVHQAARERREQRGLARVLQALRPANAGRLWFADLHSTSGEGPPFVCISDTIASRRLASALPIRCVLGLEEAVGGSLLGYLGDLGIGGIAVEGGREADPSTVDRLEAAIWLLLVRLGMVSKRTPPGGAEAARQTLRGASVSSARFFEVIYRHRVRQSARFCMKPGFRGFEPVQRGQTLASDRDGAILAPARGHVLLPLYQSVGTDGFFVARGVPRVWLGISALLRSVGFQRIVRLLPGVRPIDRPGTRLVIDRRLARWGSVELLHLLGFRAFRRGSRYLWVVRRPEPGEPGNGR